MNGWLLPSQKYSQQIKFVELLSIASYVKKSSLQTFLVVIPEWLGVRVSQKKWVPVAAVSLQRNVLKREIRDTRINNTIRSFVNVYSRFMIIVKNQQKWQRQGTKKECVRTDIYAALLSLNSNGKFHSDLRSD
jgi:hypothetical protein